MSETTVRVRKPTRDKIREQAQRHGESADAYLERLVDEDIWRERMQRVKTAMSTSGPEYLGEVREWDQISDADLVVE